MRPVRVLPHIKLDELLRRLPGAGGGRVWCLPGNTVCRRARFVGWSMTLRRSRSGCAVRGTGRRRGCEAEAARRAEESALAEEGRPAAHGPPPTIVRRQDERSVHSRLFRNLLASFTVPSREARKPTGSVKINQTIVLWPQAFEYLTPGRLHKAATGNHAKMKPATRKMST